VTADVAAQIGDRTRTLRGTLDRESLRLSVVTLPTTAERLAWLARDRGVLRLGDRLLPHRRRGGARRRLPGVTGLAVAAYSGDTPPEDRERIEADLAANRLRAVVATSALGMGYDKPDLAFVAHLGSPSSPIAYYQQVGRAGRAISSARAVLLPAAEDTAIWAYFDSTAFPPREVVERVLTTLAREGPVTVPALEESVNLRRGRLEALLKVLDVEGAVERSGAGWVRTDQPWAYDEERLAAVAANRTAEQTAMRAYATTEGCRMRFLRDALDDPGRPTAGAATAAAPTTPAGGRRTRAHGGRPRHLRGVDVALEPRKQWPRGGEARRGNIKPHLQVDTGRALAYAADPGWGDAVSAPWPRTVRSATSCSTGWPPC
jgi:ATP-dependent DNA helicase RecQ